MEHPFLSYAVPDVPDAALVCAGVRLVGDASGWITAATPFVTEAEQARARRFAHAIDAARHLIGRALVRRVLSRALSQPICDGFACTAWGKPFWPHGGVEFSIAHSGAWVWAAFCRHAPVGIDVEAAVALPDTLDLAALLHPEEFASVQALPPEERTGALYRCWTRKEAVLKAVGTGLLLPLDKFQVRTEEAERGWLVHPPESSDLAAVPPIGADAGKIAAVCGAEDIPAPWDVSPVSAHMWSTYDIAVGADHQCSVAVTAPDMRLAVSCLQHSGL